MPVSSLVKRSSSPSWAADLVHPVPLAAVGLLALNDHFLKGSGLLPGAVTGKLSDFAGLFFFPLLLAAIARGLSRAVRGRDIADRRSLAAAVAVATAVGFAAVKHVPAVNELVARTWGRMVMDPSDLWALPMVALAAAWMLRANARDARQSLPRESGRRDAHRALEFAAVLAAGLASAATSPSKPPVPPPPPPEPRPVSIVAEDPSCAGITVDTCERTATQTLVVVRAQGRWGGTCTLDVLRAEEASSQGRTAADVLPKNVVLQGGESRTFALTFLRPVSPGELSGNLNARAQISAASSDGRQSSDEVQFVGDCDGR
jgi:hypothetical protein